MAGNIYNWSTTASDNATADPDINFAEGQAPGTLNNSDRQVMARIAEILGDLGGALVAGGTANAITMTANSAFSAYADGITLAFRATADNTAATTLNVNSIGAKSIRKFNTTGEAALAGTEIQEDGIYVVRYSTDLNSSAGGWHLLNPSLDAANYVTLTGTQTLTNKTLTSPTINGGTFTGGTDIAVADGGTGASDASGARTNLGLVIGTDVQAYDATLTSLAALSGVAGDIIYASGTDAWARLAKSTAGKSLRMNSGATAPAWGGAGAPDAVLEDQKATGTNGGDFNSGAWRTRTLNTEVRDAYSVVSISSNQFTPTVDGWVEWTAPTEAVSTHQTRLQNITDGVTVAMGTSCYDRASSGTPSVGGGPVAAGKTYEIQHRCSDSTAGNGFGASGNFAGTAYEVFTRVKFWIA